MTDQRLEGMLEQRLSAYFAPRADEVAPATLRATIDAIPDRFPIRRGWFATLRSRPLLVFATIALLLALAIGAAFLAGGRPPRPLLPLPPAVIQPGLTDPPPPQLPLRMGLIAFDTGGDIIVAGPDGSNRHAITSGPATDFGAQFSPDGTKIAYWSQAPGDASQSDPKLASTSLIVMNADGSRPRVLTGGIVYPTWAGPRWSSDGQYLAYSEDAPSGTGSEIVVVEIDTATRHVVGAGTEAHWAPADPTLAYVGSGLMSLVAADGSADHVIARGVSESRRDTVRWSPDGARLAYLTTDCCGIPDTMVVDRDGTNVHPITDSTGTEAFGGWSSDGRQTVLLRSQPDGTSLVLVADADGRNARSLSVTGATGEASWSPNGLRLLIGTEGGLLIVDPAGVEPTIRIAADAPLGVSWQPVGPRTAVVTPSTAPASTPGTRRATSGFVVPFSFDAALLPWVTSERYGQGPSGERAYGVSSVDGVGIAAYADPSLFADPCYPSKGFAETGSTPAELAAVLAHTPGLEVGATTPVSVGGFSGLRVEFRSVTDPASCEQPHRLRVLETEPGVDEIYEWAGAAASTTSDEMRRDALPSGVIASRWLIIDVRGTRLVLEAWSNYAVSSPKSPIGGLDELEQTLDSIAFD